jgi:hypothetical protein
MSAGARRPERPESDIVFTAEVRARQLRFREAPETRIEFTGAPAYESATDSDRVNLPQRVEKDVTYRDVRVDYQLDVKVCYPPQADSDGVR